MKESWEMWQVGWEHEVLTVELDIEEDDCPACRSTRSVPGSDPVVIAYRKAKSDEEPTVRYMEPASPFPGLSGWLCRTATKEEIADSKKLAEEIRSGSVKELSREEIEARIDKNRERVKEYVGGDRSVGATILEMAEMFLSPTSWAVRKGHELGAKRKTKNGGDA